LGLSQMLSVIAWLVLCGSALPVAAVIAVHAWAVSLARHGKSGSEFIPMFFLPLYLLALLAGITGPIAGFWLAAMAGSTAGRVVLSSVAGAWAVPTVLVLVGLIRSVPSVLRQRAQAREWSRVIGQDEMINLMRSGSVRAFERRPGPVVVIWYERSLAASGKGRYGTQHADPGGYDAYVAAARELTPGITIEYADEDLPPKSKFRWITADEATDLLERGRVIVFHCGVNIVPASGEPTGIKIIDYGRQYHMYIDPPMEGAMMPVARAARHAHNGHPRFVIDGKREPRFQGEAG
jgi:hypothetical protein